jgi:hypothetical protein
VRGFLDGRALPGDVRRMTVRLSPKAGVELAFHPEHDPAARLQRSLFPG